MKNEENGEQRDPSPTHSQFFTRNSTFEILTPSPPHVRLPLPRLVHSLQFLVLLLLHGAQQRLGVRVALRLLFLLLLVRFGFLLRLGRAATAVAAAAVALLHGAPALGDLEITLGRGVGGAELERVGVVADGVVEGV